MYGMGKEYGDYDDDEIIFEGKYKNGEKSKNLYE